MEQKKVTLIGAPVDLGSSELGVSGGPKSFRKARAAEIFSGAGFDFDDAGDISVLLPTNKITDNIKNLEEVCAASEIIKDQTLKAIQSGSMPLVVGGDHSVSIGSINASLAAYPNLSVLWIDAHPDINTPETSITGNVHGMVTSTLTGYGNKRLMALSNKKLNSENLYYLGLKDIDVPEQEMIRKLNIYSLSIQDILLNGFGKAIGDLFAKLKDKKVHVSLDLDSIDILDAPGVGIPSRGGFDYREIKYIAQQAAKLDVVSMDVVELNSTKDIDGRTAHLAVELAVNCLGKEYSLYSDYMNQQNTIYKNIYPIRK